MSVGLVELTDGEIVVRPFRADDVTAVHEAACESIPELSRWMSWCHPNYSIEETRSFIVLCRESWERDAEYAFGSFRDGRFLGGVGLNFMNRAHQMANLGYWIRTTETGRGVASRAARLVARFGFEDLGLQRIEIIAATGNLPSQRVAEKTGAIKEAILRKRLRPQGQPADAVLYSLVAEDLPAI